MIRVFIGYDPRDAEAFQVLAHSIQTRSSLPVAIAPLMLTQLTRLLWRERHPLQSTDFSFSRFLVPLLCDFQGFALFMDGDMLMQDDIANLWALADPARAVQVVQHDHAPPPGAKSLGRTQTPYPRKNWSSVMLFNCARCAALSADYVNTASGLDLHRFSWTSDSRIGALPGRWNHLVDYDPQLPAGAISNFHFTSGGPWHADYANCGYADLWLAERRRMRAVSAARDRAPAP